MFKKTTILFLFLMLFTWTASAERNECCSNKGKIIENYCSDGKKNWAKICPFGAYGLHEEDYSLTQDDTITDNYDEIIEKDRYCLGSIDETEIIALICFKITNVSTEPDHYPYIVVGRICCAISIACLCLTIIVYILLPKLRDLQDKCIMITTLNLLFTHIILFVLSIYDNIKYTPCLIIGASLYFIYLSAYFWINIVAINIWRSSIRPQFLSNDRHIFTFYNVYGWGGPLILLTVALISHHVPGDHIKPGWTEYFCWFPAWSELLYFHIPIFVLMSINIAIFISIWKHEKNNPTNEQSADIRIHKSRKYKCKLHLKVVLIMAIDWISKPIWLLFPLNNKAIVFFSVEYYLRLITDYINALQGLIIFLVLVVFRKRVRRDLARRGGLLCGKLPKEWALIPDEEMEELEDDIEKKMK